MIAGGNFWQGLRQGLITSGLNHVAHIVAIKIEYNNKLDDALENAKLKRGDTVTKDTLKKLAVAFKDLWNGSRQWAEFANDETIAEWESNDSSKITVEKGGLKVNSDERYSDGVTNSIGQMIFNPNMIGFSTVFKLAGVFLHEISHSIDSCNGNFYGLPFDIGNEMTEIKAYNFAESWTGVYNSNIEGYKKSFNFKLGLMTLIF